MMQIASRVSMWSGARAPTAKDYVQSGLVAMWDGIENAGWGVHNPNATVWKDLIGNCDADTDPNLVYDNYMQEDGSNNMKALTSADKIDFSRLTSVTFEACFLNEKNKANYHMAIGANPDYFSIGYPTPGSTTLSWKLGTGGRPTVTGVHGTLAAVYNNGSAGMYFNGSAGQFTTSNRNWNNTLYLMWANPWRVARGEKRCYCFRLYSRALTAEEIAHNYAIDKARFGLP